MLYYKLNIAQYQIIIKIRALFHSMQGCNSFFRLIQMCSLWAEGDSLHGCRHCRIRTCMHRPWECRVSGASGNAPSACSWDCKPLNSGAVSHACNCCHSSNTSDEGPWANAGLVLVYAACYGDNHAIVSWIFIVWNSAEHRALYGCDDSTFVKTIVAKHLTSWVILIPCR